MRTVDTHLLDEKIEEAMKHFINSHQQNESVHMDASNLSLNVQDETGSRVVTVMHPPNFSSQLCRQVGDAVPPNDSSAWNEEILALVAHFPQNPRISHLHNKVPAIRPDIETSVISDAAMRLFNGPNLDQPNESIVVQVPTLPPLPPLQEMKQRCQDDWFTPKRTKRNLVKEDPPMLTVDVDRSSLEMAGASPAQNKQSKKSLPHKKRISRKLKRNTGSTPQEDVVMINCAEEMPAAEEILPDNFVTSAPHQDHMPDPAHHITHDVRPIFICQLCGQFYGEDQLKFYHHLKHHYESQTIIIENPVPDLGIDKMTNTCIVDNVPALPDSLVELSLENALPTKTIYPPMEKHVLYTTSEKIFNYTNNKVLYSMAAMDKGHSVHAEPGKELYDTMAKQESYNCTRCNKSFKKQKHCELHIKEVHNKSLHEMNEFSEPEDLMEGIYVMVDNEENAESGSSSNYADHFLPHLTVDNGHVHQEHSKHWYIRNNGQNAECSADGAYCAVCAAVRDNASPVHLKEEVLQRIFEVEVSTTENQNFAENLNIAENGEIQHDTEDSQQAGSIKVLDENQPPPEEPVPNEDATADDPTATDDDKKEQKKYACPQCPRVLNHRNSLLYHLLSHGGRRPHECDECGKAFYTTGALKIHSRVHNGDKPYKCVECGRDFRQWGDLKYHMISLHTKQKQYKCEFCSKEFARKYSLSIHRRIHTGERNYKCHYCNKSFRASCYRLSHMRTHTGERPHKCEECGKCFRAGGDLRRHMLMHEKARARHADSKNRAKTERVQDPSPHSEVSLQKEPPNTAKRPTMSTNKSVVPKTNTPAEKKPSKSRSKKADRKSAPNVTVVAKSKPNANTTLVSEQFEGMKIDSSNRITNERYEKLKEIYNEQYKIDDKSIIEHKIKTDYTSEQHSELYAKNISTQREYATLRPMYRSPVRESEDVKTYDRAENTDGKGISVYTLIEKPKECHVPIVPNQSHQNDARTVLSDGKQRTESVPNEAIENVFIERLTALYNIAHV